MPPAAALDYEWPMTKILLSIGHGYSAQAAQAALPPEWRVIVTTRSEERARAFERAGLEAVIWQAGGDEAALAAALARASHVISSLSPSEGGDPVARALADLPAPALEWVGYLSASSVYGDYGGGWVDESAPANPGTARGHARLLAETQWHEWAQARGARAALFRIAGIYGPARSVFEQLRAGRAQRVIKPGQVFSRIHVADLGRIIAAAAMARAEGAIICADSEPAPPQDVLAHGAALLGLPPPPEVPFERAELSPMALSFYAENKRLRSIRVSPELGVTLAYPDYRAGLAAILKAEGPKG